MTKLLMLAVLLVTACSTQPTKVITKLKPVPVPYKVVQPVPKELLRQHFVPQAFPFPKHWAIRDVVSVYMQMRDDLQMCNANKQQIAELKPDGR